MSKAEGMNRFVPGDGEKVGYSIKPYCLDEVGAGATLAEEAQEGTRSMRWLVEWTGGRYQRSHRYPTRSGMVVNPASTPNGNIPATAC